MDILHITSRKRDTYQVELTHSPLWECALGIAAITNKQLIDTLEKPNSYWPTLKENFSDELLRELLYVEENNTWKALLQLLHYYKGTSLSDFCQYINELDAYELKFICFPYIGEPYQEVRKSAAEGDSAANLKLIKATEDNPFFPQYVDFLFKVETARLKQHLIYVMTSWFNTVIKPKLERIEQILEFDYKSKLNRKQKLNPEELVHWATGGVHYMPEPSVYKVLLIPQFIYRPWNIEADIEGTKVFYYPVANESLSPDDKYMPSNFLVQKYKALGDDVRLRIVKLLFEKDRSLQDITNMLDMGKSTVHHHLKILRASKIVGMKETKYALKENALNMLAEELSEYLNR
ncbi:metalloregulator ArsR/SmtB family transcription factor [Shouchella clausii]|uniref:ArsR family transcriptional regulator n=1 Tax=Shouchella clausii TaxID=79880 RepID=A0A268NYV4_SHOCL|nr:MULTISPECIES: metalloregulator ArsR/SmtB family transcription factor [Shouchella]MCM3314217.1 ArsR family transcriptional regulator [Psychrobacillus sp. MER TA 17]ALA51992.1 transcriptional regulator, ArsR family [Shouchella clausii]MBU3230557.1 ArsR family transcriptional regulator [Shouchella clausii]MBU3262244.1 ArsR family transcriptional regulator [Shouchella clausii]MBU3507441.1 ArsR family transcriptional regulator [Shouchella clausii]